MAYTRKTHDEYWIEGNYGEGWECVTIESSKRDGIRMLRDYDENETQYPHRLRKIRVRNRNEVAV